MGLRLPKLFRIRARTAAALSIPLAMLCAAAGLQVTQSGREAADVREQGELATASIGPAGAINALMTERNFTSLWLFGVEQGVELHVDSVDEARERTDASLAAFEDEVRRRGGRAERIYGPAIAALAHLDDNRARVDAYDGVRNPTVENERGDRVWATYNRLVTALADANTQLANEVEDAQLRQGVRLVDMASRQVDRISKMVRVSTIEAVQAGGPITDPIEFSRGVRMMSEGDRHHLALLDLVTGPYAALREPLREESEATGIFEVEQRFSDTGEVHIAGLLRAVSIDEDESYYGFIHDVSTIIRDRADHLAAAARADQQRTIVLSVLVMVAAVGAALAVARSITAPLRSLTRQARDMAERRLPEAVREVHETPLGDDVRVPELEPVSVTSRDEVSDLADQLNAVQLAALDLAVEQAVLRRNFADVFVNLCRRIQALLGRQLDVIAEVGGAGSTGGAAHAGRAGRAGRAGPDLGEVSRYAVRLRRHAESLLVLAGVEPRPAPTAPAPLGDIVQAALREVSGSERVRLLGVEPVVVAGSAVPDLAHLLAELVESALRELFPEETVDLAGVAGRGPGSGYTLRIVDPGASLAEEEIERANRRLAGEEPDTTAPSRYLGQYVAARLAARHGISVALTGTMAAGVTATVHLPPPLLAPTPAPTATPTSTRPTPPRAAAEAPAPPAPQRGAVAEAEPPVAAGAEPSAGAGEVEPPAVVGAGPSAGAGEVESPAVVGAGPSAGAGEVEPPAVVGAGTSAGAGEVEPSGAVEAGPAVDAEVEPSGAAEAGPDAAGALAGATVLEGEPDGEADTGPLDAGRAVAAGETEVESVGREPAAAGEAEVESGAGEPVGREPAAVGEAEVELDGVESVGTEVSAAGAGTGGVRELPAAQGAARVVPPTPGRGDTSPRAPLVPPPTSGGNSRAAEGGQEPHPSGPNQVVPSGDDDDVDVYRLLSDFTEGVEHPALAVPNARRRPAPGSADADAHGG